MTLALGSPRVYSAVQRLLGATEVRRRFVHDYVEPRAGERILDLGCGPGDVVELLEDVDYTGVDISARYIRAARRRYGSRARFLRADVEKLATEMLGQFEAIIAIGVVHHLGDEAVSELVATAGSLLAPGGRFVTLDPIRMATQGGLERWLVARDRGRGIRTREGYRSLLTEHFGLVEEYVHHDLARVPYTHLIVRCREPSSSWYRDR